MSGLRPLPLPSNEAARAAAVDVVRREGSDGDPLFDEVAEIAREAFGTPTALVTLIDSDTSCFLAHAGTDIAEVPKTFSLCAHTFVSREAVVVPDALADPRWSSQPTVVSGPKVRYYVGAPVILPAGFAIGTVCVADFVPHPAPTAEQMRLLERLARIVARAHEIPNEPDAAAAAALHAAQRRAQDEFLTLVSHELRTPLNGIVGIADILEPQDEDERELVEAMRNAAAHLEAIVENVLAFTQLRSGDMTLEEAPHDLDALLDRMVATFAPIASSRGKTVRRAGPPVGRVAADGAKLEMAVACLLSDVVAHGGRTAEVSARRREDGGLAIEIADDGQGIASDAQASALRAFSHAGDVRTREADGLGLGLPLTQRLVELHGGEVRLERSGDRFHARIDLPPHRSITP